MENPEDPGQQQKQAAVDIESPTSSSGSKDRRFSDEWGSFL
jgi:hypothetical protein